MDGLGFVIATKDVHPRYAVRLAPGQQPIHFIGHVVHSRSYDIEDGYTQIGLEFVVRLGAQEQAPRCTTFTCGKAVR